MTRTLVLLGAIGTAALAMTSCNGVECGEGTFANGDTCVGYDPNDATAPVVSISPAGGRTRNPLPEVVRLTTDEPATVYFTTDGSDPDPATSTGESSPVIVVGITQGMTIKYLAVDRTGNQSVAGQAVYDSDAEPPAPITDLAISLDTTAGAAVATITWTNPTDADFTGTVFARVRDAIDGSPTAGQLYTAPMSLSASLEILSVGTATQVVDADRPPGPVRYVAWTFDDLGNYSAPVAVATEIDVGSLTAQLAYDVDAQALSIPQAPDHLDLTGSTAALNGTTLTITLSVKNDTLKYFLNPKAEVTATTGATFTGSDGTADGHPFKYLGPSSLAAGATLTVDLVFTGVAAGTTPTISLAFAHHASLLSTSGRSNGQQGVLDLGSGTILPRYQTTERGPNDRPGGKVRPAILVGGHYLDVPTTHATIERFDLVTGARVTGVNLGDGNRTVIQSLVQANGSLLAVLKVGGHRRTGAIHLVQLDEGLGILKRIELPFADERGFSRHTLSPDGNTLAIPSTGGIILVDLRTLSLVDPIPSSPGVDLIDPQFVSSFGGGGGGLEIRSVVFLDETTLFVMGRRGDHASIVRLNAEDYTTTPVTLGTTANAYAAALGPDGRVWMVFSGTSPLRAYNPDTQVMSTLSYPNQAQGLGVVNGQVWVIRSDRIRLDQVSGTGAVTRTITMPGTTSTHGIYGHWLHVVQ